jgi:hypothetical protein
MSVSPHTALLLDNPCHGYIHVGCSVSVLRNSAVSCSSRRSRSLALGLFIATRPDTLYPTVATSADPAYYGQALASDPILLPYMPALSADIPSWLTTPFTES